jgi:iron complex outermembrane recepter protein
MQTLKTILFSIAAILIFGSVITAQSVSIKVKQKDQTPLAGASVLLTYLGDSTKTGEIADQNGSANFDKIKQGIYQVKVSFIGFQTIEKTIQVKSGKQSYEYELSEDAITLGEVSVVVRRPIIRQQDDKMIIDPEPLAGISTNTLEILESTPGLFVDQDGSIFLSTASPATVFINGREQKMSSQDIANILRSLPPGSIRHIEVIRSPSAKYSASSSGGIVNIILKKGVKIGQFGSANAGINQGKYPNSVLGFSLNNMNSKSSTYLNMNFNQNDILEDLNSTRVLENKTTIQQWADTRRKSNMAFLGYGISSDLNEKFQISYDGRLNGSLPSSFSNNLNFMNNPENLNLSQTINNVENKSKFLSIQQDFGLVYKIDTLGSEWDTKLSYSLIDNNLSQNYNRDQSFPSSFLVLGDGTNKQQRHYMQFRSDFLYAFRNKITFETGVNLNWQEYKSNSDFFVEFDNNRYSDPTRTQTYQYKEIISAAYVQASFPLPGKLILKSGLRMEHSMMNGKQSIPQDTSFLVNRADWFPYVYLSRDLFKIAGFKLQSFLIYRKTIKRPDYNNLNPYTNYIDEYLYETGNPALKPQFADNFEANISLDDMPIFAVGRTFTKNIFSNVVYQDKTHSNIAVRTFDNLGKNTETYFRAMAGIPPVNRYFFMFGTQYNLNEYDGFYQDQPLKYERGSWRFFTFHSLRLFKETRITMSGFMMTKGQMGFYELDTFGQLNFGLNQTFFDKKLNVSLSARDVLRTMGVVFNINQGGIYSEGERYSDNQRYGINVRYNFGINNKQEKRNPMRFDMEE